MIGPCSEKSSPPFTGLLKSPQVLDATPPIQRQNQNKKTQKQNKKTKQMSQTLDERVLSVSDTEWRKLSQVYI